MGLSVPAARGGATVHGRRERLGRFRSRLGLEGHAPRLQPLTGGVAQRADEYRGVRGLGERGLGRVERDLVAVLRADVPEDAPAGCLVLEAGRRRCHRTLGGAEAVLDEVHAPLTDGVTPVVYGLAACTLRGAADALGGATAAAVATEGVVTTQEAAGAPRVAVGVAVVVVVMVVNL